MKPSQYAVVKIADSAVSVEGCRGFRTEELNVIYFKDSTLRSWQQIFAVHCLQMLQLMMLEVQILGGSLLLCSTICSGSVVKIIQELRFQGMILAFDLL